MRLRNGKMVRNVLDKKKRNKMIDLIFDIMFISNNIDICSNEIIKYQTISNYCDILLYEIKRSLYEEYEVEKVSFECDYLQNNNTKNKIHIKNIYNIVNTFYNSDLYVIRLEKDVKKCLNAHLYYNRDKIKNNLTCIYTLALIFFYFQMVIIETLYDECLSWNGIRQIFGKYMKLNKHLYNENNVHITDFIQFAVSLCDDIVCNDNTIFSEIRRYTMCI